ncbi:dTDP-4-amino-4,6-dideoxygalactose transaminase [Candidatus Omnitrophota bacterium]
MKIPFNKLYMTGKELEYVREAYASGHISGDGPFTKKCQLWLEQRTGTSKVLLTHSCTAALEMAAILAGIEPGDEVILPSFTFVSTANAFVVRGATPVFVDIRGDTLNVDQDQIEAVISDKTKVIVPVHYAGVACNMDAIMQIADRHNLIVVEDAAQGVNAMYQGRPLGSIGHLGAFSFHVTKDYTCGEGGALLINDQRLIERAEIIREKGTNRSRFFRGEIDKYTWVDLGSSYLPSDILAACLYAQLKHSDEIKNRRRTIFEFYYNNLKSLQDQGILRLPIIPDECSLNYHMFYLILPTESERDRLLNYLKENGISAAFHFIPLHASPMGIGFSGKKDLPVTEQMSRRILRLPFYTGLNVEEQQYIVDKIKKGTEQRDDKITSVSRIAPTPI